MPQQPEVLDSLQFPVKAYIQALLMVMTSLQSWCASEGCRKSARQEPRRPGQIRQCGQAGRCCWLPLYSHTQNAELSQAGWKRAGCLAAWPDLCSDPRVWLLYHQNFSIPATCYLLSACPMALRQPLANSHTTLFKSSQNTDGVRISVNCHPLTPMVETGREQKSVSSGRKIIIIFIYGFYNNLLYNLK